MTARSTSAAAAGMRNSRGFFERRVKNVLAHAGVAINGTRPADIRVHDARFYRRSALEGSLGLCEAYMDGWWDCEKLDELFVKLLEADLDRTAGDWRSALLGLRARLFNLQTRAGAFQIGERHYDLGNEVFERMLDSRMMYSCGYWRNAADLETAPFRQ